MAAYLTDADVRAALVAELGTSDALLPEKYAEIIPKAHAVAVGQLASFAAVRGFAGGPPVAWAAGPGFEEGQSVYWCLVKGAGLHAYDDRWVEKLNRLKELAGVTITDSTGAVILPTGTGAEAGAAVLAGRTDRLRGWPRDWCGTGEVPWGW